MYKVKIRFYIQDHPESGTVVVDAVTWLPIGRAYRTLLRWRCEYGVNADVWLEPMS